MQENGIWSVSELTQAIKKQLELRFPFVHVQGEITNFKEQSSGHLYFTLKDAQAQISAVLFRGNAAGLTRLPKNGDQVIVQGEINVYPPRGNYQLIIRQLQFAGVGELLLKLHALKAKLEAQGWFAAERKKPLPEAPKTIGVITSPTGAVIQDILNILSRRHSGFHLILNPVKVQGDGAAGEIAQAIAHFNKHALADVLIVCRGGGSLEDLWAFNEEVVAEAIYQSAIPVISAVGHETDFSISDFVADVRAPTPSAAAEIVMAAAEERLQYLRQIDKRLRQAVVHLMQNHQQKLDDFSEELTETLRRLAQTKKLELLGCQKQLQAFNPLLRLQHFRQKLQQLTAHLQAIHPKNLLSKGYSILFRENTDSVIFSSRELQAGDQVRVLMHDGEVKGKIL